MEDYVLKIVLPYLASNAPAAMMALCLLYIRSEVNRRFVLLEAEIRRTKRMLKRLVNKHSQQHSGDTLDLLSDDEDDNDHRASNK